MTDTDPLPVERSGATDRPAPESVDSETDPEGAASEKDPKSPTQKRKMTETLDDFLGSN